MWIAEQTGLSAQTQIISISHDQVADAVGCGVFDSDAAVHGAGSRGHDIDLILNNPFFQITDTNLEFPFVTVAPQCSANTWFDMFETLECFVRELVTEEYADSKRIYLMGASMGGYATWQLAMGMPEYFAAIIPICGDGMYWNAGRLVNVPIWAFHGKKDRTVFVEESVKMTEAVNRHGAVQN